MKNNILNITNGDYFNDYFKSKHDTTSVAFCEVMMDGETVCDIYSEDFIKLRCSALKVDQSKYRAKMHAYDALKQDTYHEIHLWFGKDTFCQMNLLTLLAYLEQIEYCGRIILNYINDETFEVLEPDIDVQLGKYKKIYTDILILKHMSGDIGVLDEKAIGLYFDYHSDDGMLVKLIKQNSNKNKMELICLLLEKSKDYGLSDLQAERLIELNW